MKKLLSFLLMLNVVVLPTYQIKATTSNFVVENNELIAYLGNDTNVIIPDEVKTIKERAFYDNDNINSVEMSDNVLIIEKEAFFGCENLEQINLSKNLNRIGKDAFAYTKNLKNIYIPKSLQLVEYSSNGTFFESGLERATVEFGRSELPYYLFRNSKNLKKVFLPEGIEIIQDGAFYNCDSLESIVLPHTLTYLGDGVFYHCDSLYDIVLPSKLEYMGADVFQMCVSLTDINIPKSLKRVAMTTDGIFHQTNLQNVTFEEGLTVIPSYLFREAESLPKIEFPDTLLKIDDGAFYGCDGLTEIHLPESVKELERHAFASCKQIKAVYGIDHLTYMDEKAFSTSDQVCLYGKENTIAHQVALKKGWKFVVTGLEPVDIISVEQASSCALKVRWPSINEGKEVEVYRSTSEAGKFYLVGTYSFDKNYAIIKEQKTGQTYFYKIRVVKKDDKNITSEFSEIKSGSSVLQACELRVEQNSLKWNTVSGAHYYQIYSAEGSGAKFKKIVTLSKNKREYTISNKNEKTTYYKIRGYKKYDDGNVYSKFSNIVKVKGN